MPLWAQTPCCPYRSERKTVAASDVSRTWHHFRRKCQRTTDDDCRHVPGSTPQRFSAPSPSPLSTSAHKERPSHFSLPIHAASAALLPHAHELPSPCETRGQGSPLDKGAARSLRAAPYSPRQALPTRRDQPTWSSRCGLPIPRQPQRLPTRLASRPYQQALHARWHGCSQEASNGGVTDGVTPRVPSSAVPSRRAPARGHER
jgi:hypothetical protein